MLIPIILSGGSGTRLWPLSTPVKPKQFLPLTSDRTLFQDAVLRLKGLPELADPIVVCNESHRNLVAGQLIEIGAKATAIVLEPVGRNTAPAVGLAAMLALALGAPPGTTEPILLVLPADHTIADAAAFRAAVVRATAVARNGRLVTFGVVPTHAETGFGYIELGREEGGWRSVERFVEKPDRVTAEEYVASRRFLWNSGVFAFGAATFLGELALRAPAIHAACHAAIGTAVREGEYLRLGADFLSCPSDSIDYSVMEKTDRAAVVPLAAGWSDIGSWAALYEILAKDPDGNALKGQVVALEAHGNLAMSRSRILALLGVDDLVVIESGDAILIARRDRSQSVKTLVQQLEQKFKDD